LKLRIRILCPTQERIRIKSQYAVFTKTGYLFKKLNMKKITGFCYADEFDFFILQTVKLLKENRVFAKKDPVMIIMIIKQIIERQVYLLWKLYSVH